MIASPFWESKYAEKLLAKGTGFAFRFVMELVLAYLRTLSCPHTYDARRNAYLWFGFLWGLPIPLFSIVLDFHFRTTHAASILEMLWDHPFQIFFLLHPPAFAILFGAMGTLRHEIKLENMRLIEQLTDQASTDPLTGIPNRRRVLENLSRTILRSERSGESIHIFLFDLDGFKTINDQLGHVEGDVVLRKVAAALQGALRQGEMLGRYGGDEFLLVAPGDLPDPEQILERSDRAVQEQAGLPVSGGYARWPQDAKTADGLIWVADAELARNKQKRYDARGLRRRET